MDRVKLLKNYKIYISFGITLAIALALFPMEGKFQYEYQRGRPWMYETLLAPIDFPLLKSDAELLREKELKASQIIPYFVYNSTISEEKLQEISSFPEDFHVDSRITDVIYSSFKSIYDRGVISGSEGDVSHDGMIMIQRERRAIVTPVSEVYTINRARLRLRGDLTIETSEIKADSLIMELRLYDLIVPNLIYDFKMTEVLHKEAIDFIAPSKGVIYRGQLIVSEGELITTEIEDMLNSYKAEYEKNLGYMGSPYLLIIGHGLILFFILALLFGVIYFTDINIFASMKKLNFILLMFLICFIATVLLRDINERYLYFMPYAVFALYMVSFFKQSVVFPAYMVILLPVLIIPQNGMELYFMNIIAGAMALVSFYYLNIGWSQFVNSFFIVIVIAIIYLAFRMIKEEQMFSSQNEIFIYLLLNGLFVIACYPLVFLFEKMFSFVSNSKLKDLADTNSKLLLAFAKSAPGSFQHSLQVANMADAAAREIGGNALLIRVGALYHDIGKMNNPQCFIENQAPGVKYHELLTPLESAHEIIKHVEDGVTIAKKNKIPDIVIDFIRTHHARSKTIYFYNTFINQGGDPALEDEFVYPGMLPTTKEQVIVLMADAVEAASRTLSSYTEESIGNLIDTIIDGRLSNDQLTEADISIKEINVVKRVFKDYIKQTYHERIKYPEKRKKKE